MILIGTQAVFAIIIAVCCGAAAGAFIVYRMSFNSPNAKNNILAAGIRMNAVQFSGMYEPMFAAASLRSEQQRAIFAAWHERVFSCDEDNGFKAVFNEQFGSYQKWSSSSGDRGRKKFIKKSKKLVKIFERAGIVREQETAIVGSERNAACYELAGGGEIQPGAAYRVLTPYWHLGDDVLDRGIVQ